MSDMEKILPQGDIVVVSLPYTEATHHILNNETLKFLKDDALLINIARGSIIDEQSLIENLKNLFWR